MEFISPVTLDLFIFSRVQSTSKNIKTILSHECNEFNIRRQLISFAVFLWFLNLFPSNLRHFMQYMTWRYNSFLLFTVWKYQKWYLYSVKIKDSNISTCRWMNVRLLQTIFQTKSFWKYRFKSVKKCTMYYGLKETSLIRKQYFLGI